MPTRMRPAVSDPTLPFVRILGFGGMFSLAAITLVDRGATRMYATPWTLLYWSTLAAPLLILVLRAWSLRSPLRLPAWPWLALVSAGMALVLAAALASPYRAQSLLQAAPSLAGMAVFLLLYDWLQVDPPRHQLRLEQYWAGAAAVLALASFCHWLADLGRLSHHELFSVALFEMRNPHPLGHSNYTAGLALLGLPWLVQAALRTQGRMRMGTWIIAGLMLLVLFTSGSRGGLLGLAALGIAALASARLGWKRFALLASLAIIAAGLLAFANPRIRAMLGPPDPAAEPNLSTVQRRAMFEAGVRMGADRPLLGWGPGTTPLAYPRYRAALTGGAENVLQLHSIPIEIWAGMGPAGLLACVVFLGLAFREWSRAPAAATALAGYAVFSLTDYQLDVPVFILALASLAAQLAPPAAEPATFRGRLGLAGAALAGAGLIAALGGRDRSPLLNAEALALARDSAQKPRAIALLNASLALNPDQEIAHFNLGWLLVVQDPAAAEKHFRAAARLVPDKGGVYFGLGLALLNQGHAAAAAQAFALECLNDPLFLASPWWKEPAIAAQREAAQAACAAFAAQARSALPPGTWAARQAGLIASLSPQLGLVSPGPELTYRRERTGYPVLMRNLDLPPPTDLFDVREDPRFAARLPFPLPRKGWLPSPLLLKLFDAPLPAGQ